MLLQVKVIPNGSKNQIMGWRENVLQVKITATPERGKANEAVIELLSKELNISKSSIRLVSGLISRVKKFEIEGVSEQEIKKKILERR
jgi:uncharacterized protein (TIGR00251 family)